MIYSKGWELHICILADLTIKTDSNLCVSSNLKNFKIKKPWPTKDVMNQIYDLKLWGGESFDFYSGEGSHNLDIINSYLEQVILFLSSFKEPLIVCDLGCGDFNIGRHLVKYAKSYIAIDIIEILIDRNKKK